MKKIQKKNLFPYSDSNKRYHTVDYFYKQKFHSKIFKVSLNAGFTCPNIDGTVGMGGCIYCSSLGSGDFAGKPQDDLVTQFYEVCNVMNKKWPNSKYIGYFQAHTNTYAPVSVLKEKYESILNLDQVVGLALATRPDAITEECLDYLEDLNKRTFLTVELGLQSIHESTATFINRCHSLECFEKMVIELRKRNIPVVIHIMNGLPYETKEMMLDTVRYLNTLDITGIKIHMLHILKQTKLGQLYQKNPYPMLTKDEYVDIVCDQLELLRPEIVIHRITGDPKKEDLIAPNWLLKKFDVLNSIDKELARRNTYQGFQLSLNHMRSKIISERISHHDLVYSFDSSSETIHLFSQFINKENIKTKKEDVYPETCSLIYSKDCKVDLAFCFSLLHAKGNLIIECPTFNSNYQKLGEEIVFLNTYFYIISKKELRFQ